MGKACCAFGHRNLHSYIEDEIEKIIEKLIIEENVKTFMVCGWGKFDVMFSSAVWSAKKKYDDIELILVLPYFSNKLNTNKEFAERTYDRIIIPEEVEGVHYKRAITVRNKWLIDNSDYVLTCVYREFGGAYDAMKYAEKNGKLYMNIYIQELLKDETAY